MSPFQTAEGATRSETLRQKNGQVRKGILGGLWRAARRKHYAASPPKGSGTAFVIKSKRCSTRSLR
jgi:hypothetical protein